MASSIDASTSGAGGVITTADNTGILQLKTAGTTAVTVNTTQYVGINNTSPASSLDVTGHSASNGYYNFKGYSTGRGYGSYTNSSGTIVGYIGNGGGGSMNTGAVTDFGISSAGNLLFSAGGSLNEQMRIDSSGNVCVGTTSASIYGTNTIAMVGSDGAAFKVTGGTGNDAVYAWNNATTGNNGFVRFLTEGTATFRGEITYNRGSAVVAYGTSSDVRLKENIVDSSSSLNKINSIKIRSFDWKETGIHTDYGVIAQELFEVAPEAVIEGDNSDVVEKTWQVDTSVLVPAMIKAIQEQQTIINDLKARVTALEAK